ncbi:sigma-54-dependent Fis family transcriptional regulator [bacterium]|nr:sigma-54-dependent Fis family transcriptional regulator [bacterium]
MKKKTEQKDHTMSVDELQEEVQSLRKENQFFELLIASLPGLFYLFDSDYRFHKWNKNVETVSGFSAEEIQIRLPFEVFLGEDLDKIKNGIDETFIKGGASIEANITTKEGQIIPYYWTGASTCIDKKQYMLGMGIDISKRKTAENALRESEALYRIFAERMTEGVILFRNFKILFANNAFAAMLDYKDPKDLIETNVLDLAAEGFDVYFREMFEAIQKKLCEERFFQAQWSTIKKRKIWVEGRANLIKWKEQTSVLLTARDITEAKLKEISLQEQTESLRRENITLRSSIKDHYRLGNIIGKSELMQKVYERILNAAASNANVVVYGESGTGKELVARAVHKMSRRSSKPFITVNSSAIPENLLESEFFGHKKGAFTGADSDKPGYLDAADGGTLFLDEVGDLDIGLQAKLLRALEGGGYSPVGSTVVKHSDFRIISATNKNLRNQIKSKKMREDFFYRIHIIPLYLPPLKERKEDIPLLVEHFLQQYSNETDLRQLPGQAMEAVMKYDYPGNVRELQNVIQQYLAVKSLDFLDMDGNHSAKTDTKVMSSAIGSILDLQTNIDSVEKNIIIDALKKYKNNKSHASEALGISRKTLIRKINRYNIEILS